MTLYRGWFVYGQQFQFVYGVDVYTDLPDQISWIERKENALKKLLKIKEIAKQNIYRFACVQISFPNPI